MKTILQKAAFLGCLITLLVPGASWGQTDLALWTFDILPSSPLTPDAVAANLGPQSGSAYMYLDGTHGSSSWTTGQRESGNGTQQNDPRLPAIPGDAYRLDPGANLGSNGKRFTLVFSMTGYENPVLSFALHGTATSYSTHQWAWSTDGTTFTNFGTNTANQAGNYQVKSLNMSAINQLDNATTVYLRLTVNGASSSLGRNRFDNIIVTASEQAPTFGTITQVATACAGIPTQFNITGLLPNSTSTIQYNINAGPTQVATGITSNGSGNGSVMLTLLAGNNGQTLTVTSVQRTDHPTAALPVSSMASLSVVPSITYYADSDSDTYGDNNDPQLSCSGAPSGYVANNTDCDDTDPAVNPGASEILYNGIDDNCSGTIDEGFQLTTQVKTNQCNTLLAHIYTPISAQVSIPNVTGYRFQVTNLSNSGVQVIDSPTYYFQLTDLPLYEYGTTYAVRVMLQYNGVWLGYYGSPCTVTTPSLFSGPVAITIPQCGTTLPDRFSPIFVTGPHFISSYEVRITNLTNPFGPFAVQTLVRTVGWFTLKMLSAYDYSTTYSIEVRVKTTGNYSAYTQPCNVTTPAAPSLAPNSNPAVTSAFRPVSFPNPYTDSFAIDLTTDRTDPLEIRIYDMMGLLRESTKATPSDLQSLQLGKGFTSGVYNVVVIQGDTTKSLQVIKR